jgi:type I restriction enzyme S subunit
MSSDWVETVFSDLCVITRGASPRPIHDWMTDGDGIPWVKISDATATNSRFIGKTSGKIKKDGASRSVEVFQGDLILSNSATPGIPRFMRINACIHDGWLLLRDFRGATKEYLYYLLVVERPKLVAQGNGSVFTNLKTDILKNHRVCLPPLQEQKAIAHILGTLDDKIELNRKINETLEAMAKALFKSWFVDFDPVRAKADGRPTGLPAEISDLFPDSFEDSELGEIPSGWSVRRLRDFIKPVKDRQGDRNIEEYSATVTGIEPRDSRFKKNLSSSGDKNKVALEGDLVFGLSRRTINFGRMAQPIGAFSSVYEVFRSISGSTISTKIVEQCIRSRISEFMVILKPAAREGQAIDREVLMDQLIADFPEQLSAKLETLLEPVSKRVELGSEHIFALEQLRNALLPKLISGEIRIPDAEKMLEEVGV